jgi:uncharacterized delta-60 repeat protein
MLKNKLIQKFKLISMKKILQALMLLFAINFMYSQNPADAVTSFGTSANGFGSNVKKSITLPDGKILVGGNFAFYGGNVIRGLIRLLPDGPLDSSFLVGTGFNGDVNTFTLLPDGKILVGGGFTTFNGTNNVNRIARLNSDGSLDTTFMNSTGFNNTVNFIKVQTNGKIIIGGDFSSFNGASGFNRLIRLNADGTLDNTFITGTGFNASVQIIETQSDGKILVGGEFTSYNGTTSGVTRFLRLNPDGSLDTSFVSGSGFNDTIRTILALNDDKIILGGNFTSYNSVTNINGIIKLNVNGSIDSNFLTGTGFNPSTVNTITQQTDGKLFVGGDFTSYNGASAGRRLVRLNANGSIDNSFNVATGFDNAVLSVEIQENDKILVGGNFTNFNNIAYQNRFSRLNTNATLDNSFNYGTGFNNYVFRILPLMDGKFLLTGRFTKFQGIERNNLMRLNADLSVDNTFDSGLGTGSGDIFEMVQQADGKIIIAGSFTTYNGITVNRIARLNLNGTLDTSLNIGTGFNAAVNALKLQTDGKILVGGDFSQYNSTTNVNKIARLNSDGSLDNDFYVATGTGFNNNVTGIAITSDGKIIVTGPFISYNGTSGINRIIRLFNSGLRDTTFNSGTGFNNTTSKPLILQDGSILITGSFTSYNNTTGLSRLIKLSPNGTIDATFALSQPLNNGILTIKSQSDGKLLVSGAYTTYNSLPQNRLIRLNANGTKDTTFDIGSGFNDFVYDVLPIPDGRILAAGNFKSYQGNANFSDLIALKGSSSFLDNASFDTINEIKIYPNPTTDKVTVQLQSYDNTKTTIYDLNGRLIQEINITEGQNTIDISTLEKGIYILSITNGKENYNKRIIKN